MLAGTATSGSDLPPNTWAEIALVIIAACLAATLIIRRTTITSWAAISLAAFAALALLTALSIAWSVTPDLSWLEAARTTAYLAAFGAAMALARLLPDRWPVLLAVVGAAAVILTGWALVVKVFTLGAGGQPQYGRLLAPFGYWNATGLMAGIRGGEGFVLEHFTGAGTLVIAAAGNFLELNPANFGGVVQVHTGCIVAFQDHLTYSVERMGAMGGKMLMNAVFGDGSTVATISGDGQVLIQSVTLDALARTLQGHMSGQGEEKKQGGLGGLAGIAGQF